MAVCRLLLFFLIFECLGDVYRFLVIFCSIFMYFRLEGDFGVKTNLSQDMFGLDRGFDNLFRSRSFSPPDAFG